MKTLLSTKILTSAQKEPLTRDGFHLVEYDAISIKFIDFRLPDLLGNLIFTSQNAVLAFLEKLVVKNKSELNCFCVGEKTKSLLEKNQLKVIKTAKNASELVTFITKNYQNELFSFFCGNRRLDEIPFALKKAKIAFNEVKTYENKLNVVCFDQKWNKILFFSPSGVESFMQGQLMRNVASIPEKTIVICIGKTTASEAKKYTKNVIVSKNSTVESVIQEAFKII